MTQLTERDSATKFDAVRLNVVSPGLVEKEELYVFPSSENREPEKLWIVGSIRIPQGGAFVAAATTHNNNTNNKCHIVLCRM